MAKIIHYRNKCIGCGICQDMQPGLWRMSKKDGRATLVQGIQKKQVYILSILQSQEEKTREVASACPVRVIHLDA